MNKLYIIILITIISTAACKKYQNDDPAFHLKSVANRIVGQWDFNGISANYVFQFTKDRKVVAIANNEAYETIWEISYDKQKFYMRLFNNQNQEIIDADFYIITRLDQNEMWLGEPGNSSYTKYTLIRK